jgi:hypothetical protein
MRPGRLAVRAANEYRNRDIISYLGLRYYLLATSSRSDRWSREIASELVRRREALPYRKSKVYKGVSERKTGDESWLIEYRPLHLPGPTEMLCESALLDACSVKGGPFSRKKSVFSNVLCEGNSREGMVEPYFKLWRERQNQIASCCRLSPNEIVVYFDLTKFYPSVEHDLINKAWALACQTSKLERGWESLGERIITDYKAILEPQKRGLPMGPMFSHILGNLVLSDFDLKMALKYKGRYFRYVDDIAIVLPKSKQVDAKNHIISFLPPGLQLNQSKQVEMSTDCWLQNFNTFEGAVSSKDWMRLISVIKAFAIMRPTDAHALFESLRSLEFRFPFHDYTAAIKNRNALDRFKALWSKGWFREKIRAQDASAILAMSLHARKVYFFKLNLLLSEELPRDGMSRKLHLQRVRYLASRLLYLATSEQLKTVLVGIEGIMELLDLAAIYRSLIECDVTDLLPFSESVTRVAAQVLSASGKAVECRRRLITEELISAWSVLRAYGVLVDFKGIEESPLGPLANFVDSEVQCPDRKAMHPFYREIITLKMGEAASTMDLLSTALDETEHSVLDAVGMFHGSS